MRRVTLLLALVISVASLAGGLDPVGVTTTCAARGTGLQAPTYPHLGCVNNQCVEIYECGVDDCSACSGCNPADEQACLASGGIWNPETCTCSPSCSPGDEQACVEDWGQWDPNTCTCWNACNANPPQLVYSYSYSELLWCISVGWGMVNHVDGHHYEQRCQDGRLWDSWNIETGAAYEDVWEGCVG
jgi:hypothetical protein